MTSINSALDIPLCDESTMLVPIYKVAVTHDVKIKFVIISMRRSFKMAFLCGQMMAEQLPYKAFYDKGKDFHLFLHL
jgi:hypothetical protein